ncbi:hypothetical protein EDD85DRAFT_798927 [Armillaria nabsnona]|nr:hypothetical protein EDD85DRAFT_798927 [Armillaria nabsnona]
MKGGVQTGTGDVLMVPNSGARGWNHGGEGIQLDLTPWRKTVSVQMIDWRASCRWWSYRSGSCCRNIGIKYKTCRKSLEKGRGGTCSAGNAASTTPMNTVLKVASQRKIVFVGVMRSAGGSKPLENSRPCKRLMRGWWHCDGWGMVTVRNTATAPPEGGEIIAVVVEAVLKSAVIVVGGVRQIDAEGGGGKRSRHTGTAAVYTAVVLEFEVESRKRAVIAVKGEDGSDIVKSRRRNQDDVDDDQSGIGDSSSRKVVFTVRGLEDGVGGDGGDPTTTAGLATVYTEAVAPLKCVDIISAVLKALKKSVGTVEGEMEENREIGGGGEQTASLGTV